MYQSCQEKIMYLTPPSLPKYQKLHQKSQKNEQLYPHIKNFLTQLKTPQSIQEANKKIVQTKERIINQSFKLQDFYHFKSLKGKVQIQQKKQKQQIEKINHNKKMVQKNSWNAVNQLQGQLSSLRLEINLIQKQKCQEIMQELNQIKQLKQKKNQQLKNQLKSIQKSFEDHDRKMKIQERSIKKLTNCSNIKNKIQELRKDCLKKLQFQKDKRQKQEATMIDIMKQMMIKLQSKQKYSNT